MAEKIDLTTPIAGTASRNNYTVIGVVLYWGLNETDAYIKARLLGDDGLVVSHNVGQGPVARTRMIALNKANLSSNSLQKRVLDQLVTDGVLAGTISGTPD